MKKLSVYDLTLHELSAWLSQYGYKNFQALKFWKSLYRDHARDFSEINAVKADCVALIKDNFSFSALQEKCRQEASDGTIKFLFTLPDGNLIETVLMRHKFGRSVCITTQVGCNMGCSFCASGLNGKLRNLSCGEIVEQIVKVQQYLNQDEPGELVSHVVVMGIGEPFDNFVNLLSVIEIIKDQHGLVIAPRRITVSTSGLAEKIYAFADADLKVNLAVSLHAPNDALRSALMKVNDAYPLAKLFQAVDYYLARSRRRITFEYILLKNVNDRPEDAYELAALIGKRNANINLIPYNPVDEHSQYQRTPHERQLEFYDILKKHRLLCSIRLEQGSDIAAACGQLRSKHL